MDPKTPPDSALLPTPVPSGSMQKTGHAATDDDEGLINKVLSSSEETHQRHPHEQHHHPHGNSEQNENGQDDDDNNHDDDSSSSNKDQNAKAAGLSHPLTPDRLNHNQIHFSKAPKKEEKDVEVSMPQTPPQTARLASSSGNLYELDEPINSSPPIGLGLVTENSKQEPESTSSSPVQKMKKQPRPRQVNQDLLAGVEDLTSDDITQMDQEQLQQKLSTAVQAIVELKRCNGEYEDCLTHSELQNQLLTIQSHEASQRFEVENSIVKREVDRLVYDQNGGLNENAEIYRRRLRKAKARLRDVERSNMEKNAEIEKLRKRIRDGRVYREALEAAAAAASAAAAAHQPPHPQYSPQHPHHHNHPPPNLQQQQAIAAAAYQQHYAYQHHLQQLHLQNSRAAAHHHDEASSHSPPGPEPLSSPSKANHATTPQAYPPSTPNQATITTAEQSPTSTTAGTPRSTEESGLAALGMLASQVLQQQGPPPQGSPGSNSKGSAAHSKSNSSSSVEEKAGLMSPVDFKESSRSLAEKRRRESSASTISVHTDDDDDGNKDEHETEDENDDTIDEIKSSPKSPKYVRS